MSALGDVPGLGWVSMKHLAAFSMGRNTYEVMMTLHSDNRAKLVSLLTSIGYRSGVILLCGGDETNKYDSDIEYVFRQDSWFSYLFGVKEPGVWGAIRLPDGETSLFIPKSPDEYRIWCGTIYPPNYYVDKYGVNNVFYVSELSCWLGNELLVSSTQGGKIFILEGTNSDSGRQPLLRQFQGDMAVTKYFDKAVLYNQLAICRVQKSTLEIDLLAYVAWVTSMAHVAVMRHAKVGMMEYEFEARFLYEIYKSGGCRHAAYTSICACGPNSAVLHYGHAAAPNDLCLADGMMALLDMGAEYHGYASDITCSFPITGTFTTDQRGVFEGVLAAQRVVLEAIRPGVSWVLCHELAEREILKALIFLGVLVGELEDIYTAGLGSIFMPHGLGHLIGCDVHDVGGYIDGVTPSRPTQPGKSKLRTARILEERMVLTNEPGCYFIPFLLEQALARTDQAVYINRDRLDHFKGFGGVRLEDMIVVTEDGVENLTQCPRTVAEIEGVMAGGDWPPTTDEAPYLKRRWRRLSNDCTIMEPTK